ncbi:MAG: methionyl-tRNA formyltransferase [Candidatus Aminicenantes bacterium]|nr:methionyl-tRNA formyltransferase [Candidatus Aminicenantes bacterium]
MNIVFFGSPQTAIPSLKALLKAGHSVPLVITQPDRPSGRGRNLKPCPVKKFAEKNKIPVLQPAKIRKDKECFNALKKINPDINVVAAYGQIIPSEIIYLPRYDSINIHFSYLPKYRGASPVQWALLNGEKKTGITLFRLNEKMDQGDILARKSVWIRQDENSMELEERLAEMSAPFLVETLSKIGTILPEPQDHTKATYAPLISKQDGRIKWEKTAESIYNQVRAFFPWPSSFTFFDKKRMKIIKTNDLNQKAETPVSPGEITNIDEKGITVGCGGNTLLLIEKLQPENKKAMSAHSFSLGARIKPGDTFE